jgi:hypothetical protein
MMGESDPGEILNLFPDFSTGVLNSFSPRSISFTVSAVGEGSIDPFFRFLDSSGKSAEMS